MSPEHGGLLVQSRVMELVQIIVSLANNLAIVVLAAAIAGRCDRKPLWLSVQRYLLGLTLGGVAIRPAAE